MTKEKEQEQDLPDVSEDKKSLMDWIKAHKNELKNKDAMMELLDNLKDEVEKANLYSSKWFEKATDAELNAAREKVRLDYCASGDDFKAACSLQNLLGRFDMELSKRACCPI